MLFGLETTKNWLVESIRNNYYFASGRARAERQELYVGWINAATALTISKAYIKNKQDYLEWVDLWKRVYAKLTDESRLAKNNRKTSRPIAIEDAEYNAKFAQYILRGFARDLLELREVVKEEAASRYVAEKQKELA